jgi:hypothetical protein
MRRGARCPGVDSGTGRHPPIPIDEERCTVSVPSALTTGPSVQMGEAVRGDLVLFANAAVDDQVEIKLSA